LETCTAYLSVSVLALSQAAERRLFEQEALDAGKAELGNLHCILERFCAYSLTGGREALF